jgi:hydrogenase nickel incorporation protein HypA/HybF
MHEMSVAENILEIIQRHAPVQDKTRVKVIRLRIGELAGVVPESLRFCFEVMSKGTVAEGAELMIERVPLVGRCHECDFDFHVEGYVFVCPRCHSPQIEVISGHELEVMEMEVEDEGCP